METKEAEIPFKSKAWPQYLGALIGGQAAFILGTVLGWSSTAIPALVAEGEFGEVTSEQSSWIASLAILGCLLSTFPGGYAVGKVGRRQTMLLSCLPLFLGWVLILFADSIRMIYCGRLIIGFFSGIFSQSVPMYLNEIAEGRLKGQLGSFFALQSVIGVLVAYILGTFFRWREMSFILASVSPILFVGLFFLPESPAFYLTQGKEYEAAEALRWLRGAKDVKEIEPELKLMKSAGGGDTSGSQLKLKDWFSPKILKPLGVCIVLMIVNQWSGIGVAIFYTVQIFESAGSTMSPNTSAIIVGVAQVVGVALSGQVIDRLGRRILIILSCLACVLCFVPMGIFYYVKDVLNNGEVPSNTGFVPLVCLVTYMVVFSIGLGPIPWILTGELMPMNAKGTATAITTTFNWGACFLLSKVFEKLAGILGQHYCYWIFAGFCLFGAVFTYFFLPETKQKSVEKA